MDTDGTDSPTLELEAILRVTNNASLPTTLRMEPWGREVILPADATHALVLTGPARAEIDIEVSPSEIVVHGWTGAVLDGIGLPVPETPRAAGDL